MSNAITGVVCRLILAVAFIVTSESVQAQLDPINKIVAINKEEAKPALQKGILLGCVCTGQAVAGPLSDAEGAYRAKNFTKTAKLSMPLAQQEEAPADMPAIGKDHCGGCHAVEKKLYAPAFRDIAIKYRSEADAVNKLTENINRGGAFGWNMGMRMPAKGLGANDREIKAMVEFILGLPIADSNSEYSQRIPE